MLLNRLAAIAFATLLCGGQTAWAQGSCAADLALIRLNDQQVLSFDIEVVDTPESRAQGLMYRKDVPPGTGMLFIYEQPQRVSFWMRNTLVPLDMVFLDASGVIRHIHPNARPLDETPVPGALIGDPHPDRLMVLEIAGGEAARLGLADGQALAHPALDQDAAEFPCS
ncbi:DUF192 domain-containing protein [Paracoccus sp. R86501]|uniref:DUF192 domain-containing protein n=1 Tax=Paracoccus sp. R86501 TaxID=3101711 RepID=UPI0036700D3E